MKGDFAEVFGGAFLQAFTPETVKATFEATGVYPFNPDVITEKKMGPSLPTSVKGTFPLLQPSPVHAIIAAMGSQPATSFDLSPTTHSMSVARPLHIIQSPQTLSCICDPNINPELNETPSKCVRQLYTALASTTSGLMLVSKARIMSAHDVMQPILESAPELSQPNWSILQEPQDVYQSRNMLEVQNQELTESLQRAQMIIHAQELIGEWQSAQLVIQHAHLVKLYQSLHANAKKKKSDWAVLFLSGFGQHLTDEEFGQQLAKHSQRKEAEVAEKAW
jgi:hypothetical protein